MKHSVLLPPHGAVGGALTSTLILGLVWGVAWSVLGDLATPTPDTVTIQVCAVQNSTVQYSAI